MNEEVKIQEAVEEIKNSDENTLKETIKKWFESTQTQGMKIGASYISAAIFGVIKKHTIKKEKASLRDYKRAMDEIIKIISVQLTEQNDSDKEVVEETANDGTAE
jgi:hypothetical protein